MTSQVLSRFIESPYGVDVEDRRLLAHQCLYDYSFYVRLFFRVLEGYNLILNDHHTVLLDTLDKVLAGEITRLIINMPPGCSKTLFTVIYLISYLLARYPKARSVHLSANDSLVNDNSRYIQDIIRSPHYKSLFNREIRHDASAKGLWLTREGGKLLALTTGSGVVGHRAGDFNQDIVDYCTGILVIDDPLKPEDAYSATTRHRMNRRISSTCRSRTALETVPIMLVHQRLHDDDATGFLLRGGTGDKWHHVCMPVHSEHDPYDYPKDYTHAVPIKYKQKKGPLWELKYDEAAIIKLREGDPYTYSTQYAQSPVQLGGNILKVIWWGDFEYYDYAKNLIHFSDGRTVRLMRKAIYADTAQKAKEYNDYSVFLLAGRGADRNLYLLDLMRGKWEAPQLQENFLAFCDRHAKRMGSIVLDVEARYIEDKSSGIGLIQGVQHERGRTFVKGIPRHIDKVTRVMGVAPEVSKGRVYLPRTELWVPEFVEECKNFSALGTHSHDDQVDVLCDAIEDNLMRNTFSYRDVV